MSEVFISYSRYNKVFADMLATELEQNNRSVWMDRVQIRFTADWWDEIKHGIENSDNFVLLMSPDSLGSPVCHLEIEYARKLTKRIIPINYLAHDYITSKERFGTRLYQDDQEGFLLQLFGDRNPMLVFESNWRFLPGINRIDANESSFSEAGDTSLLNIDEARFMIFFSKFRQALDTDMVHVHQHTRLFARSQEWEMSNRKSSFLLNGMETLEAEEWLASWQNDAAERGTRSLPPKDPQPDDSIRNYIAQSRTVESERLRIAEEQVSRTRRLRIATVFASIVGTIAAIVSLIAINQSTIATNERAAAVTAENQLAGRATAFALEQWYASTLSAGGIIVPIGTQTPNFLIPTLTQMAELNSRAPIMNRDEYGVEMVLVPKGCFFMGSLASRDEQPINQVCFDSDFWIDRFEVTVRQFDQLDGAAEELNNWLGPFQPRTNLTWYEAQAYCSKRRNASLPSESQWEWAARGPNNYIYPWGNEFPDLSVENDYLIYYDNSGELDSAGSGQPRPVGLDFREKGASWVGAYDMSGNVWEWTNTIYDVITFEDKVAQLQSRFPYPFATNDGREAVTSDDTDLRTLRGGSFSNDASNARSSDRLRNTPDDRYRNVGLRCVRNDLPIH